MSLQAKLSLSTPIVQAPMAGASNADFVIKACQLGVLGSLGAGMMSPNQMADEIDKIKAGTDRAFNVNLMILDDKDSQHYQTAMPTWLSGLYDELGVVPALDKTPAHRFCEQLQVLLDNPVPVASFTFGILDKSQVEALQGVGSLVVGTANTPDEVLAWQAVGADAVVVQGLEAGGHQGGWLKLDERLSAFELLALARQVSDVPLIVAGGMASADDVARAKAQGADLVAVGTAFLTTTDSPISPLWKKRLLNATGNDTRLTRLYSGKWARGVITDYMARFAHLDNEGDLPSYPTLNAMTKSLRAYGASSQNSELLSLWAGTGVGACRDESMSELIARLSVSD